MFSNYTIFEMLARWQGKQLFDFTAAPLFGDASGRQYVRVKAAGKSLIFMHVAESKPGEFGRGDTYFDFVAMQKHLASLGLLVPEVLYKEDALRALILEDLGDETLFSIIEREPSKKIAVVMEALDTLITWQKTLYTREKWSSVGDKRSFKQPLFMEEFWHFHEYMVKKRVYWPPQKNLWEKAEKQFKAISNKLAAAPYILSHRDFQSKNLMRRKGQIHIIDFQDALQAPLVYDLVALLRDSYVSLTAKELDMLLDHYWDNSEIAQECLVTKEALRELFFLQTLQRKMKDAGRFIFLHQVKGKEWFLPFVRPTLFYVRDAAIMLNMEPLLKLYEPYIPEFASGV